MIISNTGSKDKSGEYLYEARATNKRSQIYDVSKIISTMIGK